MKSKKRTEGKVEIAGVEVSQVLIDSVVRATSNPETIDSIEEHEQAKVHRTLLDHELRQDIDVSKQLVGALLEQAARPESQRVSVDMLPPELKRVIDAHVSLREAQEEYDAAVVALQKTSSQATAQVS